MSTVRFPGKAVDPTSEDVAAPVQQLLRDLELLPQVTDAKVTVTGGTPESLQVIRAGALDLTKVWAAVTGAGGAAGVATTLVAAAKAASDPIQITLIAGASVILAATAIAIALIVRSDVAGRASTTAQLYRSRAQVTNTFLASLVAMETGTGTGSAPAGTGSSDTLAKLLAAFQVDVPGQDASSGLFGVRKRSATDPYQVRRGDGDWVDFGPNATFKVSLPPPASP